MHNHNEQLSKVQLRKAIISKIQYMHTFLLCQYPRDSLSLEMRVPCCKFVPFL